MDEWTLCWAADSTSYNQSHCCAQYEAELEVETGGIRDYEEEQRGWEVVQV